MSFGLSASLTRTVLRAKMTSDSLPHRLAALAFTYIFLPCSFALPLFASPQDYSAIESAIQQGRFAWAQQELESRLSAEPQDFQAQMLLGIVLEETEPSSGGRTTLAAGGSITNPKSAAAHINLGKHDARVGNPAGAVAELQTAVHLSPDDPAAHNNLGLALISQGKAAQALREFQSAAQFGPEDPATWFNLFKCHLALKHFPQARAAANRVVSLTPSSAELFNQIGALQAEAGDNNGAIESLNRLQSR